jgi:uncharacterized protein (DUF1778 family)
MENETQLQIRLSADEKELIKRASGIMSIGHSTFARVVCLEKARTLLKENKEVLFQ